jgi:hypothetical protein
VRKVLAIPAFSRQIMRGPGMAYIVVYGAYILIWVLILKLVFLVSPFDAIGRSVAATDAAGNFQDSPLAEIKSPVGVVIRSRGVAPIRAERPFSAAGRRHWLSQELAFR